MNYVIISPVKNEEKFIAQTIESVLSQTLQPNLWLIINDGSTDNTHAVVEQYAAGNHFIRLLNREGNHNRDVGYGGIKAFNYGIQEINPSEFDFIVNLDGDVRFGPGYFENLFAKFNEMPDLGIAGGQRWSYFGRHLILEKMPEDHVSGATKVYRRECYLDIQPIKELPSWDAVDELYAQSRGWKTQSFNDIKIIHLRPTTLSADSAIKGQFMLGKNSYRLGYPVGFIILRSIKNMFEPPYLIGGILLFLGFLTSQLSGEQVLLEANLVKYLRNKQKARIYNYFYSVTKKAVKTIWR